MMTYQFTEQDLNDVISQRILVIDWNREKLEKLDWSGIKDLLKTFTREVIYDAANFSRDS